MNSICRVRRDAPFSPQEQAGASRRTLRSNRELISGLFLTILSTKPHSTHLSRTVPAFAGEFPVPYIRNRGMQLQHKPVLGLPDSTGFYVPVNSILFLIG